MSERLYSRDEIAAAMSRAADDVIEHAELPDTGARDCVNLAVNAGVHYLENPMANLFEAIEASYQRGAVEVLDWCREG